MDNPWDRLAQLHRDAGIRDVGYNSQNTLAPICELKDRDEVNRYVDELFKNPEQPRNMDRLKLTLYQLVGHFIGEVLTLQKREQTEKNFLIGQDDFYNDRLEILSESDIERNLQNFSGHPKDLQTLAANGFLRQGCLETFKHFLNRCFASYESEIAKFTESASNNAKLFLTYKEILHRKSVLNLPNPQVVSEPRSDMLTGFSTPNSNFWDGVENIRSQFQTKFPNVTLTSQNFKRLAGKLHYIAMRRAYVHQDLTQIALEPKVDGVYELVGDSPEACEFELKNEKIPNLEDLRMDVRTEIPRVGCPFLFTTIQGETSQRAREYLHAWFMELAERFYFPIVEKNN